VVAVTAVVKTLDQKILPHNCKKVEMRRFVIAGYPLISKKQIARLLEATGRSVF
jgi:hypothetical protein